MTPVPLLYFASYALSLLGNSIAAVALPLLVLQSTGSLLSTGVLAASTALPAFVVGLFSGVIIDRINRRTSSVVSDVISGLSIAALPLVDLFTGLDIGWFILFGIIGSIGDVPGMTAREALLPAIVRSSTLSTERMIGIRESIGALVIIVGPAAAGGLMVAFDGSTVLWITAATSLLAALLTLVIPRRVGALAAALPTGDAVKPSGWSELREGWTVLFSTRPLLRAVTLLSLAMVVVITALQGILLPAHFTVIARPELLGFVLTALAAGTLLGGGIFAVIAGRISRRIWFVVGLVGTAVGISAVAVLPVLPVLFGGAFVLGFASGLMGSVTGVLMVEGIPDRMRGRILGTQNSLMMVAAPVGMVAVSVLGHFFDLRTAGITIGAFWLLATVAAVVSPHLRNLGSTAPDPGVESTVERTPVDEKQ